MLKIDYFRQLWALDTEFCSQPGELPVPVCLVALEIRTGVVRRYWVDELNKMERAPFPTGRDSLIVSYGASAEMTIFKVLGWPYPEHILDLHFEFSLLTNGLPMPKKRGLIVALCHYGEKAMTVDEKETNRELVLKGGPWTTEERQQILDYCQQDVEATARLFHRMISQIEIGQAIVFRGQYSVALAEMHWHGVPVDLETYELIKACWGQIQDRLICDVNQVIPVFTNREFKLKLFADWVMQRIPDWPRTQTGRLELAEKTMSHMAKRYPEIALLAELRKSLACLRANTLQLGRDGRNRVFLNAFGSVTGRNQPSSTKFVFCGSKWLRSLIRPEPDQFLAYIDWSSQEIGIAASLSGDQNLAMAYQGDPYLHFARIAGAVPENATRASHGAEREIFKATQLGVGYGMTEYSLAGRIGKQMTQARHLIEQHHEAFPTYWRWVESVINYGLLRGSIHTSTGWQRKIIMPANLRSLQNWPVQSNGSDIMRLAACMLVKSGIQVCTTVHDAFLIQGPVSQATEIVSSAQSIMAEASRIILNGFELRSDAKIIMPGERLHDPVGSLFFDRIMNLVREINP